MITMFNRAVLFQDSDSKACAEVWSALKKHRIEYEMKTLSDHSTFGRNLHYKQSMSIGGGGLGGSPFGEDELCVCHLCQKERSRTCEKGL